MIIWCKNCAVEIRQYEDTKEWYHWQPTIPTRCFMVLGGLDKEFNHIKDWHYMLKAEPDMRYEGVKEYLKQKQKPEIQSL